MNSSSEGMHHTKERVDTRMRFKTPLAALTAASVLALAACGGGGASNTDTGDGGNVGFVPGTGRDVGATGPYTVEGATAGGTATVQAGLGWLSTSWDPRGAYYGNVMQTLSALSTRSLTQYRYDVETQDAVLVPDIATDLGQSNDDYTEWTFTLKDGITYANGTAITAGDIEASVEAAMDCGTFADCPAGYLLTDLVGGPEYKAGKDVAGVEATDDKTIVFKFSVPFPDFAGYAAFPMFTPIPKGTAAAASPKAYVDMLGELATGPYKLASATAKQLTFERNDKWVADSDPARAALPDTWVFDASRDSTAIDATLLADRGDAQTSLMPFNISSSSLAQWQADAADRIMPGSQPVTWYLAPDYRKITDKKVREALVYAYPYVSAFKAAKAIIGKTRLFTGQIMPPGVPQREEYNFLPDHELGTTDPAKARALLEEAGKLGFELKFLWYDSGDGIGAAVKDIQVKAFNDAGFKATPVATTPENYSTDRKDPKSDINLRIAGWGSDWASGSSWFPPLIACTDIAKIGFGSNYAAFCEEDVDAKIEEIKAMSLEDQPKAWSDLDKYVMETYAPWAPLYNEGLIYARGSKVMNAYLDPSFGEPAYKNIWIQQ